MWACNELKADFLNSYDNAKSGVRTDKVNFKKKNTAKKGIPQGINPYYKITKIPR